MEIVMNEKEMENGMDLVFDFIYKDYSKEELLALVKNLQKEKSELEKLVTHYQIELKYSK